MLKTYDISATAHMADHIYKNAKMGADSITDALKGIKDSEEKEKIKSELTRQYGEYENIATRAEKFLIEMNVKPGDKVIMSKYSGTEVKYQGQEYVIVRVGDILAIVD